MEPMAVPPLPSEIVKDILPVTPLVLTDEKDRTAPLYETEPFTRLPVLLAADMVRISPLASLLPDKADLRTPA